MKQSADLTQLRENIREHGVILPVYYYAGELLDGNRRAMCALETGQAFQSVFLDSLEVAARLLWTLHPRRAHDKFARELPLVAAARLLGASPSAVADLRRPAKVKRSYKPCVKLELRAKLNHAARGAWHDLVTEHRCSVTEAVNALVWVAKDPNGAALFRYYIKQGRMT